MPLLRDTDRILIPNGYLAHQTKTPRMTPCGSVVLLIKVYPKRKNPGFSNAETTLEVGHLCQ